MTCTVVFRLTGSRLDGQWRLMPDEWNGTVVRLNMAEESPAARVRMVPTGNVEWDGDRAAEVWVMEDRLEVWRTEHDPEMVR